MKSWKRFLLTNVLFLKVLIAFSVGILCAEYIRDKSILFSIPLFVALFFYAIYRLFQVKRSKIIDISVFCSILLFGILFHLYQLYQQEKSIQNVAPFLDQNNYFIFRLDEKPLKKGHSYRLEGTVLYSKNTKNDAPLHEKILVYTPLNAPLDSDYYGKIYQIYGRLSEPQTSHYDFEFNYKKWLNRKNISAILYAKNIQIRSKELNFWYRLKIIPLQIRDYYEREIDRYIPNPMSNDIAKSLLIGVRSDIDKELYSAYADTGTIHLLSVSGLHFGILILFLEFMLSFSIKNETFKLVIKHSVSFIYALMTGFSPPVMRSFLMFFLLDIEKISNTKTSPFNILFFSAWIILLFQTNQLFDIGFQLSYAAILGIMVLYNRMVWKIQFQTYLSNLLWQSSITMFSAWLFTAPLTIYYFHKLSFLGMISNFFVIPLTTITMYLGFIMMLLSKFSWIASPIGQCISYLIYAQNEIIVWFSHIHLASIYPIYFSPSMVLLGFISLFFLILFLRFKDSTSYRFLTLSVLSSIFLFSFQSYQIKKEASWYIIPSYRYSGFIYKNLNEIHVFADSIDENTAQFFLEGLRAKTGIIHITHHHAQDYFKHIEMNYGISKNTSPRQFILCRENKNDWKIIINSSDHFILARNLGYDKESIIDQLKSKNKQYIEH